MLIDQALEKTVAVCWVREVRRVGQKTVTFAKRFLARGLELVGVAAADQRGGAGLGKLVGAGQPNA